MKRAILLAVTALAGCGDDAPARRDAPERNVAVAMPMPELAPPPEATTQEADSSEDAATALKRYYERIEAGDYDAAWSMRGGGGGDEAARRRFAENFKAYARYRAEVGTPSRPARQGDYEFVEVPVMITGAFRGGKPFGTSGSVTLRRGVAGGADGTWRVYTGERKPALR